MADEILNAKNALDALAVAVKDGWESDQTLNEVWGWNCPPVDRHDLAYLATRVGDQLDEVPVEKLTKTVLTYLAGVPARVTQLRNSTIPNLFNGNAAGAFSAYKGFLDDISTTVAPFLERREVDWTSVEAKKQMPTALLRRLRAVDNQINELEARAGDLTEKIALIDNAHASAEALPTDLASLKEAREQVDADLKEAQSALKRAKDAAENSEESLSLIVEKHNDAEKIVVNLEDAYSAATTVGLGQSFAERAKKLAGSMWVWVGLLTVSLFAGAVLSLVRLAELKDVLKNANPNMGLIWINIVLGVVSVAGPVWLAWVATKQIGQRFRLSEDYAFKASVAKAYEGYRREAARIDEKFAKELFGSALSRLDEAPLRYVEHETYGSPWHEMTAAKAGQRPSIIASTVGRLRRTKRSKSEEIETDETPASE
ncbi:MAG TPA: hypothetical protein VL200_12065 [Lacunisphaera sp.]|nr:hypothetical protein [Lacunisphaera sp.]